MTEYVEVEMMPMSLHTSGLSVLCDVGQDSDLWLPLSQFETPPDDSDLRTTGIYEIKEWLAKEKGLI